MTTEHLRIQDLKDRIADLSDHNAAHDLLNPNASNQLLWTKQNILKQSDHAVAEANLKALEAADKVKQDEYGLVAYKELRKKEYPSIQEQLDKIYHGGIDEWKADIKAVKDKYPKP